ncbi:hypothetical protein ACFFX1_47935 [Dactylosporangium sucinum]|uniref:Uncharacterized protein n=1 Tax=Dactylosporangium sucinum TaxID=1424081 RepID=A0A917TMX5_9ACTN|nr:hypothetical protein [Dactylosporangium sucinum]GGM29475.1 hypothetical protein GCM10007977_033440 [Dactylosporangium sucinum]
MTGDTGPVSPGPGALLAVLADARAMLARPGNDFSWSSFADAQTALAELDAFAAAVRSGVATPAGLPVLFAPTGPIQEVALSSGWGDEFLELAGRFDAA